MRREAIRRDELAYRRDPFDWPVEVPAPVMLARVEARARQLRRRRRAAVAAAPVPFLCIALLIGVLNPMVPESNVRTVPAGETHVDGPTATTTNTTAGPAMVPAANVDGVDGPRRGVNAATVPAAAVPAGEPGHVGVPAPPNDRPLPTAATGRVAFVRGQRIWVMSADGTGERPVTSANQRWIAHHWAPDGRLLAEHVTATRSRLAVWDVDAGTRQYLPGSGYGAPRFSPDGRWIAYFATRQSEPTTAEAAVWVMRADGTEQRMVAAGGNVPQWTGDGRRLMFHSGRGIEIVDVDGDNRRLLTAKYSWPKVSPDGSRVLAMRPDGHGHWSLDSLVPDMTSPLPILSDYNERAEWSPDGEWIAVERITAGDGCGMPGIALCHRVMRNIWLVRNDGTGLHRLTVGSDDTNLTFGPPAKQR